MSDDTAWRVKYAQRFFYEGIFLKEGKKKSRTKIKKKKTKR